MAQYPIDIKMDTAPAAQGLSSLDKQLDAVQKSTVGAAKAANSLTSSTDEVAKASLALAQQQVKQLAQTAALADATRKQTQVSLDNITAMKQGVTNANQLNEINKTQAGLARVVASASQQQAEALSDLKSAQQQLAVAQAPFIKQQQEQKAAQDAVAQSAREQAQAAKDAAQAQKKAAQDQVQAQREAQKAAQDQARAQAQLQSQQDRLNKSNTDYVNSLRNQVQVARLSGSSAASLAAQQKLNANATAEQRAEVEKLSRELYNLKNAQEQSKTGFEGLIGVGKALIGLAVANQIYDWGKAFVDTATKVQLLQSRIALYSSSQAEANQTFAQLTQIANKVGAPLENTAQIFQRFAATGQSLGIGSQELLKFTDTLQKAAVVSGASAQESSAALYQLSQSFASGRLQGDEFRSVSEQLPIVLRILAKELGVTVGQLKQMGTDGDITSDKLLLINNASDDLNKQFERMPRTVEQASNALTNNMSVAIQELDRQIGASQNLARFLDWVAGGVANTAGLIKSAADLDKVAQATNKLNMLTKERADNTQAIDELEDSIRKGYQSNTYGGYTKFVNDTSDAQAELTRRRKMDIDLAKQQKAAMDAIENTKPLPQGIATKAGQFSSDITKAVIKPTPDKDVEKQVKSLKEQNEYTKALADGNYALAASAKLGNKATKEQIATYAELLKQQTEFKAGQKADKKDARDAESAANRAAKQLERNQQANEKYIETLKTKVAAGGLDLQATKISIELQRAQSTATDDQVAKIQELVKAQNTYSLSAAQKEAQSKLNKDATDAERKSVDDLVASQFAQQQAAKTAQNFSNLSNDLTQSSNTDLQNGMANIGSQESDRYAVLQQARELDLVNEQEYQDAKSKIQADADKQRTRLTATSTNTNLANVAAGFQGFSQLAAQFAGDQNKRQKVAFATMKAFAIAASGLQLAQALITALADPSDVIWPVKLAHIGAVAAAGAGMIATISSANYADGGFVNGPGTGRSDSIPANLSRGEFVSTAATTSRYKNTLEAMNNGTYRENGMGSQMPNVNIINNSSQPVTGTVTSISRDEVSIMIQDQVPDIMAGEASDPYSEFSKSINAEYSMSRNN